MLDRGGVILEDGEYLRRDLSLVARGRVARRRIFWAGLLHHPPIVVEDREGESAGGTVLIGFHGGTASAEESEKRVRWEVLMDTVSERLTLPSLLWQGQSRSSPYLPNSACLRLPGRVEVSGRCVGLCNLAL